MIIIRDTADNLINFGLHLAYYDRAKSQGDNLMANKYMDMLKFILQLEPDFKEILQEQIDECL